MTRKDFKIVLLHQDKKFFISGLLNVIQDEIPLILVAGQCINSEQFLRAHLSHRMCNQFTKQSNAIILYDTFPAHCTFLLENHERESFCVTSTSSKDPYKNNWMKELVAGGSEGSQQTQPRSKTQLSSTVRLVKSCVSMFVERLDRDSDADEDVE